MEKYDEQFWKKIKSTRIHVFDSNWIGISVDMIELAQNHKQTRLFSLVQKYTKSIGSYVGIATGQGPEFVEKVWLGTAMWSFFVESSNLSVCVWE